MAPFACGLILRHYFEAFEQFLVSGVPIELDFWGVGDCLSVVLFICGLDFIVFKLRLIAGGSFEVHFRPAVLRIWAFFDFGRSGGLEVVLVCSGIFQFGWVLEAIVRYLFAFVDEGVFFWVVVVLESEGLELLGVR